MIIAWKVEAYGIQMGPNSIWNDDGRATTIPDAA